MFCGALWDQLLEIKSESLKNTLWLDIWEYLFELLVCLFYSSNSCLAFVGSDAVLLGYMILVVLDIFLWLVLLAG